LIQLILNFIIIYISFGRRFLHLFIELILFFQCFTE
jgi:hypothetical protein